MTICSCCASSSEKVKNCIADVFEGWAGIVSRCSIFIFIVACAIAGLLYSGNSHFDAYDDVDFSFAPHVSKAILT